MIQETSDYLEKGRNYLCRAAGNRWNDCRGAFSGKALKKNGIKMLIPKEQERKKSDAPDL